MTRSQFNDLENFFRAQTLALIGTCMGHSPKQVEMMLQIQRDIALRISAWLELNSTTQEPPNATQ